MNFKEKLSNVVEKNDSLLCVGLDIDEDKIPKSISPFEFNKKIIDATKDLVCAYKLNMAFYEVFGKKCFELIERTVDHIPDDIVVILDGKRNDIGNTAKKYAKSLFEALKADAVTVNPYLGIDGIKPFLEYKNKCSFILCRTSNPSAREFQDLISNDKSIYEKVAEKIKDWNKIGCCGAVVGATYPEELKNIRKILGEDTPLLIPGIGKQGGDLKKAVKYGGKNTIIVSARSIIYAKKPREEALKLREKINEFRK
jgi:orotidine-5'-phosphate decarboxylase